MTPNFITGIMQDFGAQGRTAEGIAILEELIRQEKPELCGTCSPEAAASAFGGRSRIIAAFNVPANSTPRVIGWMQLVKTDIVFAPPRFNIVRYWGSNSYLKCNLFKALFVRCKELARTQWQASRLEVFASQPEIVDTLEGIGGELERVRGHNNAWKGYLPTASHWNEGLDRQSFSGKLRLPHILMDEDRWQAVITYVEPIPKKVKRSDWGKSNMG